MITHKHIEIGSIMNIEISLVFRVCKEITPHDTSVLFENPCLFQSVKVKASTLSEIFQGEACSKRLK